MSDVPLKISLNSSRTESACICHPSGPGSDNSWPDGPPFFELDCPVHGIHDVVYRGGREICMKDGQDWPCSHARSQPLCHFCLRISCGGSCVER